jgi:hypothetical protein
MRGLPKKYFVVFHSSGIKVYSNCVGVKDVVVALYAAFLEESQEPPFVFIIEPVGCLLFKRECYNQIYSLCFQDMRIREN